MAPEDFQFLARLLRRRSGLSLTLDKRALVARRLAPVMRRFDFKDAGSLIEELRAGREALAEAVTEAMTVNDSSFFRIPPCSRRCAMPSCRDWSRRGAVKSACASGFRRWRPARRLIRWRFS